METITVETTIGAPVEKVWSVFHEPEHIVKWGSASDDWHTTKAANDLRAGGTFLYRMEAKDGSAGFDMGGTYDEVIPHELIRYTMGDGRTVRVEFKKEGEGTHIVETFDAERENSIGMQRGGWQAILDNLKKYTEAL